MVVTPHEVVRQDQDEPPPFSSRAAEQRPRRGRGRGRLRRGVRRGAAGRRQERGLGAGFAPKFIASTVPERFDPFELHRGPRAQERRARPPSTAAPPTASGLKLGDTDRRRRRAQRQALPAGRRQRDRRHVVRRLVVGHADPARRPARGRAARASSTSCWWRAPGVSAEQLRARARCCRASVRVETAGQNANARQTRSTRTSATCGSSCWCSRGVVAVVAAFLIFNTFSITVAQRIREFGLLRTLGASRRQILWSVVGEALAIATAGSVAGMVGRPRRRGRAARAVHRDRHRPAQQRHRARAAHHGHRAGRGPVVTLIASLVPALRATRVTPMAALRRPSCPWPQRGRRCLSHRDPWPRAAWRCC